MAKYGVLEQSNDLCLHAKFHLDRFILMPSRRPLTAKPPKFCHFLDFNVVVLPFGGDLRKLNMGAELQTIPIQQYDIKIVSVLQCLHGKIVGTNRRSKA